MSGFKPIMTMGKRPLMGNKSSYEAGWNDPQVSAREAGSKRAPSRSSAFVAMGSRKRLCLSSNEIG